MASIDSVSGIRVPRTANLTVRSCKGSLKLVPERIWRHATEVPCPGCQVMVGFVRDEQYLDKPVYRVAGHCLWGVQRRLQGASQQGSAALPVTEGRELAMEPAVQDQANPYRTYDPGWREKEATLPGF